MEKTSTASPNPQLPLRAAQYVRMSTEHQQYSPENQLEVVRQYAASQNMEIVQAYSDHGRSGLNIAGREGLNRLMTDVENKQADFSALLVYDVSRWAATYPFWMSSMRTASCPVPGEGAQS
jgi:DNA invertase Pin-like site-specific DNA recombinase